MRDQTSAFASPGTISVSRNVTISGHRTSIRLQREMWDAIEEICRREKISLHQLCTRIAEGKASRSLTSEVRVYVVSYFRAAANDDGHRRAGHGTLTPPSNGGASGLETGAHFT